MKDVREILMKIEVIDSAIGAIGILIILGAALFMQYFYHEEPCPLCHLQRAAFFNIGIALILNLRYRNRVSHWAMVILSASVGMAVSIRQILLHINDPGGFGNVLVVFHLYTWSFLAFAAAIVIAGIMLLIYPENDEAKIRSPS